MAIDINIPSQVKNYANLAGFPVTGSLKTIYIAEDTNKTYRWTGSAYVEISASQAASWGTITGTLSNQTDLQTALNAKVTGNTAITGATKTKVTYDSKGLITSGADATTADIADSLNKRYVTDANLTVIGNTSGVNTGDQTLSGLGGVPTTRTLTINGTTQDLSADRTFTISTGITIGTTAITSGTVGRVLFEGTGNVVSESANLFWDNTTPKLTVTGQLAVTGLVTLTNNIEFNSYNRTIANSSFPLSAISTNQVRSLNDLYDSGGTNGFTFYNNGGTIRGRIYATGNWFIGASPTDAGFKLDVNGTARVSDNLLLTNGIIATSTATTRLQGSLNYFTHNRIGSSGALGFKIAVSGTDVSFWRRDDGSGDVEFGNATIYGLSLFTNNTSKVYIASGGQVGIGTTAPNANALLDLTSTTRGFLPPRMTTTQKNAIASPAEGLQVWDTTLKLMSVYNGTTWITL
jgi:hypothetical protein